MSKPERDWFETLIAVPALLGLAAVVYLLISVIFLGGGNACPQNLC